MARERRCVLAADAKPVIARIRATRWHRSENLAATPTSGPSRPITFATLLTMS
jgi:hypothetical protein